MQCRVAQPASANRPARVVIVGHSSVRRLGEYMTSTPGRANLGLSGVQLYTVAGGGATLRPRPRWRRARGQWQRQWCMEFLLPDVSAMRPDVIYLHLGENDLRGMSEDEILYHIMRSVQRLSHCCTTHTVIIGQLIPFPALTPDQRESVFIINRLLSQFLEPTPHTFWCHRAGFIQASPELFLPDRVHLNADGMGRYWGSVHTVVRRVLRHNHPGFQH